MNKTFYKLQINNIKQKITEQNLNLIKTNFKIINNKNNFYFRMINMIIKSKIPILVP